MDSFSDVASDRANRKMVTSTFEDSNMVIQIEKDSDDKDHKKATDGIDDQYKVIYLRNMT